MKKLFTIIAVALLTSCPDNTMAQSISVDITSGGLEKALGGENNYTALTIRGSIDVRDFAYINQYIDGLVSIDLSQCEITGYDSREEQYFGYRSHFEANEIPPASFFGFTSLESVKLPESTTAINDGAFAGCSKLNQITWPAAIETIGDYAFNSCDALGSPIFPASLRTIGDYAFNKCSSIEELDFTNCTRLTKIGACAFSLDTSLTTIQLPASITYLGDGALAGCYNLKNVTMQPCTLQMGDAVFAQCHSLQQIDLSQTWLQRLPAWSFSGCKILASAILPASLTHIKEGAFYYCEALTTASLPAGITTLADFAFAGCKGLDSITFMEEGIEQIGRYSFYHNTAADSVAIPTTVAYIGDHAFDGCINARSFLSLRDMPAELGELVFANMDVENKSLYVKEESVAIYSSTPQWQDFGYINTPSAEEKVMAPEKRIKTSFEHYLLRVTATEIMDEVRLYDTAGLLLKQVAPHDSEVVIDTRSFPGNIYILHITTADKEQAALKIARIIR